MNKEDNYLTPFEIEWPNRNARQLKALVDGIKYILDGGIVLKNESKRNN